MLNNDTTVDPEFLTELVRVAESSPSIGIAGPKVYFYDFPNRIQSAGARIDLYRGTSPSIGSRQIDKGQYDKSEVVDYVPGCCMLLKNEVILKVGVLDESYFCYWEETDYCLRARRAGYKIVYTPQAKIWHKAPTKEKIWHSRVRSGKKTDMVSYFMARNNFKFMRKHATRWQYCSFVIYFFTYQFWFTTGVCLLFHRDIRELIGFYRGVRDGLFCSDHASRVHIKD
ncbi:MAG: N-acetylglucosaminyl-diphospho-decaprenol L-rhamnosyltransferase [candidate division WS2 bacterium]|nr:N-acetylglucosaminyl-diphospho-decaprenol L-rhamnosyltransferase [Candidatus Psychracetigena formicireducens]